MPRGGRRPGAGRKPEISAEDAKFIREDCEQRARAQRKRQWEKQIERNLKKRGVDWGVDKRGRSPTELGDPAWDAAKLMEYRKKYNPIVSEYGLNPHKRIPEDLPTRVEAAIIAVRENRKAAGEIYSTTTLPRLYNNFRQKIIAAVANDHGVSPRTVRTIWESDPPKDV